MRACHSLLVSFVLLAGPASAQFYPAPGPGPRPSPGPFSPHVTQVSRTTGPSPNAEQLRAEIRKGARSGQFSHKQARELRREAGAIAELEQRYAADGLSDFERAELVSREEALRSIVESTPFARSK